MHEQWAIRAAERGKHVFCEKPLATSAAAAQRMVDAAAGSGVLLMEAMVFRYHPQTLRLRRLLDAGAIGDLRHVDVRMGAPLGPGNIRWQPELGGGALMDIGCYVITVARWAAGAEPTRVTAVWQEDRGGRRRPPPGAAAGVSGRRGGHPVRRLRHRLDARRAPGRLRRHPAHRAADPSLRGERLYPHHPAGHRAGHPATTAYARSPPPSTTSTIACSTAPRRVWPTPTPSPPCASWTPPPSRHAPAAPYNWIRTARAGVRCGAPRRSRGG